MTKTIKLSEKQKEVKSGNLSERQWDAIRYMRGVISNPHVYGLNANTINALFKRGLVEYTDNEHIKLTELGKTINL